MRTSNYHFAQAGNLTQERRKLHDYIHYKTVYKTESKQENIKGDK